MDTYFIVFTTCGSAENASLITNEILQKKMAACVQRISSMHSAYWWNGKICEADEILLMIKTKESALSGLIGEIKRHHEYDTPEIVSMPLGESYPPYLAWISENVSH